MKDLIVKTANPESLDKTLNNIGAVVMQNPDGSYPVVKGGYRCRALNGNTDFLRFAIKNQGYGEIIGELEELPEHGGF